MKNLPTCIELDITYDCNLRCIDCNRQCRQVPSKEQMSLGQVERFVRQSQEQGKSWERLSLLGGEPTLHPELKEIVRLVQPVAQSVRVGSNRLKEVKPEELGLRPCDVIAGDPKTDPWRANFLAANIAPCDLRPDLGEEHYRSLDCWIPNRCGVGLTPHGYYLCGIAGAIDRVFYLREGHTELKALLDLEELNRLQTVFCRLCMHGCEDTPRSTIPLYSQTWLEALLSQHTHELELPRFPE